MQINGAIQIAKGKGTSQFESIILQKKNETILNYYNQLFQSLLKEFKDVISEEILLSLPPMR